MAHAKCPTCDRRINLTEKHFGRKVQCSCGKVLRIPARNPSSTSQSSVSQAASSAPIQFSCPTCMTLLEVGGEMAGKLSACPCGTEITVPPGTDVANDPMFADPDPLTDPFSNNYAAGSQAALTSSVPSYTKSHASPPSQVSSGKTRKKEKNSLFEGEIIGGIAMMVGATIWFVAGLFFGYIFFYPPILFVIGLVGVIKGLLD